jgi:iron transport multicopper oxidase
MNDTQGLKIKIESGKTYMFRMVNIGGFAGQYFWIEGHNLTVVEVDGVYTEPMDATMLYFTTAQRYSFLLTARNDTKGNFAITGSMDEV